MNDKIDIGKKLFDIFSNNWNEIFLFDGIENRKITYREFFTYILKFKEKLEILGLKKNDTVCFLVSNSLELVILYFASLFLGLKIIPIDVEKGTDEIQEILSLSNFDLLIYENIQINSSKLLVSINEFKIISTDLVDISKIESFKKINFDDVFLITFTSGSTGIPKGVIHSFRNLFESSIALNRFFDFSKNNIFYHNLPMSYMAGILNLIVLPLVCESKIVIGNRFNLSNMSNFWEIPIKYSVNTFWFIPTILELLLKLDRRNDGIIYSQKANLLGLVGTAPLNSKTKTQFEEKYSIPLYESYGLSETLFVSSNSYEFQKNNSVGKLLQNVELMFSQNNEIIIKVPWMFKNYLNIDSKDFFKNNFYLTGDLGKLDSENFLFITGRSKNIIIKGGINISPKKIEDLVLDFKFIDDVTIVGTKDEILGEKIVCFIVPNINFTENEKKLINSQIIKNLGISYHIDEFFVLDKIPRTVNGKIDKPKIREKFNLH